MAYDPSKYLNYKELTELLKEFVVEYPGYCSMESIGKTREDRDIWLLTLTDSTTGDASSKPAYWVSGNIHASELSGCQAAVHSIFKLLDGVNKNESRAVEILKYNTLYVVPRISPDGVEAVLKGGHYRSVNYHYPDVEAPGYFPEDMDGDGVVRTLLKKDPGGIWKKSKNDPRNFNLQKGQ